MNVENSPTTWLQTFILHIEKIASDSEMWFKIGLAVVHIIIIYLGAKILVSILRQTVARIFERSHSPLRLTEKRRKTLQALLNSIILNVVYFIAIIMILDIIGLPLAPLLAGAGVAGLAIGFGAQNIVRDVITGFFIIYEDQFSVGDFIETGKYSGTVQEIGLRVTKLKEWTGQVHIIPNGVITEVTNYSKENSMAVLDLSISYEENLEHIEQVLTDLLEEISIQEENIVGSLSILGVQNLGTSDVVLRIAVECQPMTHWAIARKLRKAIKNSFAERGIDLPYPRLVIINREEKI